jgi:pyruvate dehydrogenase E1 component alpha subunit
MTREQTEHAAAARDSDGQGGYEPLVGRSRTIDLGTIEELHFLDPDGNVVDDRAPSFDRNELLRIYRAMVLTRKLDERMLAMQRQGEMGTFAPGFGQEATQIGQVYPLTSTDWYSPSYRSFGAQLWRGWTIEGLLLLWFGFFEGFEVPEGVNDLPFSIVIGSQVPVATGLGMAIRAKGEDGVAVVNFGDGASSQGAVNEALNFAAVYQSPVIFVCENNGYAISVPASKQAGISEFARRGPAFGMPAVRVDGNDILAMIHATQQATDRARSGGGPTFIEAVTYRMRHHTTADDPTVYRDEAEVERWQRFCPIARFEKYLEANGVLTDGMAEAVAAECDEAVRAGRDAFRKQCIPRPKEVFDFMYEELPPELESQRAEYLAKLNRQGIEEPDRPA